MPTDVAATEPVTISPEPPRNPGLDYALLKREGTDLAQKLSGAIWTDYNEHDPGVTTLEQLCYALTELSYRAELPLADLLTRPRTGRIDARRQALYPAGVILPCNPVTEGDYRKLLVDRVRGVHNAWLRPLPAVEPGFVDGLYEIDVYVPGLDPCCEGAGESAESVRRRVTRVYAAHRNLCEDMQPPVRVLEPLRVVVCADLVIGGRVDPEFVLARALFDLGLLLAPELHRRSLQSLLDEGLTPDQIFVGPLLRNGFIDDAQLQPKADCIGLQEIANTLARTRGVRGVRNLRVYQGADRREVKGGVRVAPHEIPALESRTPEGGYTLRLLRNGVLYDPKASRVERELARLWAEWRRPVKLAPQYRELLPFPVGQACDLRRYTSIQEQYPRVYGIGSGGLPAGASDARRAQARQLKGYLLAFEQLLADYFAQLSRARDLYSLAPLPRTYFFQSLENSVPDVAPLLKPDYRSGLRELVRSQDDVLARHNRFLDVLLALYAERLEADDVSEFGPQGDQDDDALARLARAKRALLRRLPRATRDRGRGFDVLAAPAPSNEAGMLIKTRIQLGFEPRPAPLCELLDEQALQLAGPRSRPSLGRALGRHGEHVGKTFVVARSGGVRSEPAPSPLRGQAVSEALLQAAARRGNVRVGTLPGEREVALVCRAGRGEEWRLLGRYADAEAAHAAGCALRDVAGDVARRSGQVYVVEHILLRYAREPQAEAQTPGEAGCPPPPPDDFVYGFTASIVIAAPARLRDDDGWRRFAEEVTRANAPAHVALDFLFLGARGLCRFERLYWAWRRALREGDPRQRARASARLRDFLARRRPSTEGEERA